jgi:hypothetical protein
MRRLMQAVCLAAAIGFSAPSLSVPVVAQATDDVRQAGKDAGHAGKKAAVAGKDAGIAAGDAAKKVGEAAADAAKGTTDVVTRNPPKGSTGVCKDGSYTKAKSKQGACRRTVASTSGSKLNHRQRGSLVVSLVLGILLAADLPPRRRVHVALCGRLSCRERTAEGRRHRRGHHMTTKPTSARSRSLDGLAGFEDDSLLSWLSSQGVAQQARV